MRKVLIPVAVAALVVAAVGGVAYASVPGPDGVIHGCYEDGGHSDGALYVIDSEDTCPEGSTGLDWNQTAPAGVAGYEIVVDEWTAPSQSYTLMSRDANCPEGKVALGGGGASGYIQFSKPIMSGGEAVGWTVQGGKTPGSTSENLSVSVWAICASAGS
jgi:hypothetical protein